MSFSYMLDPFVPTSEVRLARASKNQVSISWNPSECPASDFIVEYLLTHSDQCLPVQGQRTEVGVFNGDSATINNLDPFSSYTIFVKATSTNGDTVEQSVNIQTEEDDTG